MEINKILDAREKRSQIIKSYQDNGVISIKANIPGDNKNLPISFFLIDLFNVKIKKIIDIKKEIFISSDDGPYYLMIVNKDEKIKEKLINLEDTHPLGRFIDLDLFIEKSHSMTRKDLNQPYRKCILCNQDAYICIRRHAHTPYEIIHKIEEEIKKFINEFVKRACLYELNLEDKFGLVTPTTNGSHPDMNYELMHKAVTIITPYFGEMFMVGLKASNLNEAYWQGKLVGLNAEKAMFDATNNINCYKGLIFILGLVCISLGYVIYNRQSYNDIFTNIAIMTKDIFHEQKYHTFGEYAFKKYQFSGARGEAYLGFPNVLKAISTLKSFKEINDESLHMTLISIIKNIDDTVMLKRAQSIEKYQYFKNLIMQISDYNLQQIKDITNTFNKHNISCGGAADILIAALFIYQLEKIFW